MRRLGFIRLTRSIKYPYRYNAFDIDFFMPSEDLHRLVHEKLKEKFSSISFDPYFRFDFRFDEKSDEAFFQLIIDDWMEL